MSPEFIQQSSLRKLVISYPEESVLQRLCPDFSETLRIPSRIRELTLERVIIGVNGVLEPAIHACT